MKKPINAERVAEQQKKSLYPEPFAAKMLGRKKRKLGDAFGLDNFGVNLTELSPNASSALFHYHATQDEFIYILSGHGKLRLGNDVFEISEGDCIGFKAGEAVAHQVINSGDTPLKYLEVGDRSENDVVEYPEDDLRATMQFDGTWLFTNKLDRPY